MSTTIDPKLNEHTKKLFGLLAPHRTSDLMQRINLFTVAKTEKKLPDYVQGDAPIEDKIALCEELIAIMESGDYSKLPEVPKGQAAPSNPPKGTAQSKPAPAKAEKLAPPVHVPSSSVPLQAPPATVTAGSEGGTVTIKDKAVFTSPSSEQAEANEEETLLRKLLEMRSSKGGLTEEQVRAIVRDEVQALLRGIVRSEIATVFTTTAEVLAGK